MKDSLRCILLPLQDKTLILPYAAVAEVISYITPQPSPHPNEWLLGEIEWQGIQIPLISLEKMEDSVQVRLSTTDLHIVVLNSIIETPALTFLGLLLHGLPTMRSFRESDLEKVAHSKEPYLMSVKARGESVYIPNLPWIEEAVAHH